MYIDNLQKLLDLVENLKTTAKNLKKMADNNLEYEDISVSFNYREYDYLGDSSYTSYNNIRYEYDKNSRDIDIYFE